MAPLTDHDSRARASLSKLAGELHELEAAIAAATAGGAPLAWPLFEVFLRLTAAAEVCERVVKDHATGAAQVSDMALADVATTLRLVREVTMSLMRVALRTQGNLN